MGLAIDYIRSSKNYRALPLNIWSKGISIMGDRLSDK
jgi:hypothetical protein